MWRQCYYAYIDPHDERTGGFWRDPTVARHYWGSAEQCSISAALN